MFKPTNKQIEISFFSHWSAVLMTHAWLETRKLNVVGYFACICATFCCLSHRSAFQTVVWLYWLPEVQFTHQAAGMHAECGFGSVLLKVLPWKRHCTDGSICPNDPQTINTTIEDGYFTLITTSSCLQFSACCLNILQCWFSFLSLAHKDFFSFTKRHEIPKCFSVLCCLHLQSFTEWWYPRKLFSERLDELSFCSL